MAAFDAYAEERFVDRAASYVRTEFGSAIDPIDDVELRAMVKNGIARARRHGITLESSLVRFLLLMFQVAPNFDEHPAFACVLADADLPEE
jgi:hypothetical protein